MQSTPTPTLASTNPAGAFCAILAPHGDSRRAWALACTLIAEAADRRPAEVRAFLDDDAWGTLFGNGVANFLVAGASLEAALAATTARWMDVRVDAMTARDCGIAAGLPLLTGIVDAVGRGTAD